MDVVHRGPMTGLLGGVVLLGMLHASVGLDARGWAVGLLCASALAFVLAKALTRHRVGALGPADRVTLTRAVLSCGAAGLVAGSSGGHGAGVALVGLAAVGLLLDWLDGQVARRTGTASGFGAAFDMESDAFLVLVLSVQVAQSAGPWVLLAGAARYGLLVGAWLLPWLRTPTPPRYWGKVVAATQGVVLTVAAADVVPPPVMAAALLAALGLLAESFGHQVWWLWRHRTPTASPAILRPLEQMAR
jgi:phosphatidylglycerophosphate synthase